MAKIAERVWSWEFPVPPETLWPLIADTQRFNEAGRGPKYTLEERPRPDGSVERLARLKLGPLTLLWEERPYEWVQNRTFTQCRRFRSGPFKTFGPILTLEPTATGSRVSYGLRIEPANLFGRLILRCGFFKKTGAIIDRLVREAAEFAAGRRATPFDFKDPDLPAGARERTLAIAARLDEGGYALARRLGDHLLSAPESEVERIRPKTLALLWGVPSRAAIELCLAAAKAGLLDLRWDLLCPRCRGAKATVASLDQLPQGAHCPSCNIDYGRNFTRNVEATFRPAPAIRSIAPGGFCLASPLATDHVRVQQILAPGEDRVVAAELAPGPYRIRTLEAGGERDLDYAGGAFPSVVATGAAIALAEPSPAGVIALRNAGAIERTIVIESRDWVKDALTAHEVTTLQAFRDLFAAEALRPGDEVEINQVTLMFTDLKGSTALYSRMGDARAYNVVREHYAFLGRTIREHDGAIVKTIGDAVMAAFAEPAAAVRAALALQRDLARFNREAEAASGAGPIVIKLGLHAGPCIAVTLNDRLDYFGSTVNLAARLQQQSEGADIVISRAVIDDPSVRPLLAGLALANETAPVKGFAEPVRFWRLRAGAADVSATAA